MFLPKFRLVKGLFSIICLLFISATAFSQTVFTAEKEVENVTISIESEGLELSGYIEDETLYFSIFNPNGATTVSFVVQQDNVMLTSGDTSIGQNGTYDGFVENVNEGRKTTIIVENLLTGEIFELVI